MQKIISVSSEPIIQTMGSHKRHRELNPEIEEKLIEFAKSKLQAWPYSCDRLIMSLNSCDISKEISELCVTDRPLIESIFQNEINKLLKSEAELPITTDFERLDDAFNELIQRGIFCVHNVQTTPSSCYSEVMSVLNEYRKLKETDPSLVHFDPDSIWAVAFYHVQDTDRVAQGEPLGIAYIAVADGPQKKTDVVRAKLEILSVFKQYGLSLTETTLDTSKKILISLRWRPTYRRVLKLNETVGQLKPPAYLINQLSLDTLSTLVESKLEYLSRVSELNITIEFLETQLATWLMPLLIRLTRFGNESKPLRIKLLKAILQQSITIENQFNEKEKATFRQINAMSYYGFEALWSVSEIYKLPRLLAKVDSISENATLLLQSLEKV